MNILVVEDDPMLRDGLADLLSGAGHRVDTASDGADGARQELLGKLQEVQVHRGLGIERPVRFPCQPLKRPVRPLLSEISGNGLLQFPDRDVRVERP